MSLFRGILIVMLGGVYLGSAQTPPSAAPGPVFGSIDVKGNQVKVGKDLALPRKRFYLFPGDMQKNADLVGRIKEAKITSRDCYYTQNGASPCFIAWLKKDNCETPFCRKIDNDDLLITEFQDAYNKGLALYAKKPCIALDWVINNLPEKLAGGFYRQQRKVIDDTLMGVKPIESTMTTEKAQATFSKVPVGETASKFVVSNVLPAEVGSKSYVWICELSVGKGKTVSAVLATDEANAAMKKAGCMVFVKDLQACSTEACEKKVPETPACVPGATQPVATGTGQPATAPKKPASRTRRR